MSKRDVEFLETATRLVRDICEFSEKGDYGVRFVARLAQLR